MRTSQIMTKGDLRNLDKLYINAFSDAYKYKNLHREILGIKRLMKKYDNTKGVYQKNVIYGKIKNKIRCMA